MAIVCTRYAAVCLLLVSFAACAAARFGDHLASAVDKANAANSVAGPYYDYTDGPFGPAHWGELSPDWKLCSDAEDQSPINIDTETVMLDRWMDIPIKTTYKPAPAVVINNAHTAEVVWPAGSINLRDVDYTLKGFVFHTPSEHTVDGKSFPLEMELVHVADDGFHAVISVLFEYGSTNEWLNKFWSLIPAADKVGVPKEIGLLSPAGIDLDLEHYYKYVGSLTTPGCTEDVTYTVLSTVSSVSEEQIEHLRSVMPGPNNRPVQPQGDRVVRFPRVVSA